KQGQRDDQVDHQLHVEFLLALFPSLLVAEYLADGVCWDDRFQQVQPHLLTHLVVEGEMAYAKGHEATPSCDIIRRFLQYVTTVASPYLYGIGGRLRRPLLGHLLNLRFVVVPNIPIQEIYVKAYIAGPLFNDA